jgi:hypothetical protein
MSDLTRPSPNISALATLYPEGDFPSHIDVFGKGGFVVLNDQIGASAPDDFINERITHQRRKEGMLVYVSSNSSYYRCVVTGSNQSEGEWSKQYFSGRYFQGPSAPTASDLVLGEKWFNTTVGSEFTYLYTDENQDEFIWVDIDHLGQGETGFVRISGDTMTGTLTGINASFLGITATNGFIGTFTGTNASFTGLTATNGFVGTLTGTDASFSTLTASNGFVGTFTGTNASFMGITASNGFIGTLTDMSVMITGDYSFDVGILSVGQTSNHTPENPNVPRIQSQGGVLIGGNTLTKQNWLGNNVYLAPEGYVTIGIPNNVPSGWFEGKTFTDPGGTYPFDLRALNVTGGIYANGILEVSPALSTDPENWVFVAGSVTGDSGQYANALTAANNFAISSISNPDHKGAVFSIGDLYVGRTGIRENALLRVSGRALKVTGPADFQSNEYVTKSYVDNNTMLRDSGANPNGQNWRVLRFGGQVTTGTDSIRDSVNGGQTSFTINGPRDLGFGNPYDIQVTRIPIAGGGSNTGWSANMATFRAYGLSNSDTIILDYKSVGGGAGTNPPDDDRVRFPTSSDSTTKVTIATNTGNYGVIFIVNITPGS